MSRSAADAGDLLAATTRRLLGDTCDGMVVCLVDPADRRLIPLVIDHVSPERAAAAVEFVSDEWPERGLLADVLRTGEACRIDGRVIAPVKDGEDVIGTLGVWRDVTECTYSVREQALVEHYARMIAPAVAELARRHSLRGASGALEQGPDSLATLERLFDVSSALFALVSADGYFTSVNPAWERVLGWSADELTSRPFVDFVHPDDRAETIAESSRVEPGSEMVDFDNRYRTRDGDYRWLSWSATTDGTTWFAVAIDVTARKEAEQAEAERARQESLLAAIVECSDDAILAKTLDGTVTAWNSAARRQYGYTADEAIGAKIGDLIIPADLAGEELSIADRVVSGGKVSHYETRRRRKDGSTLHVSVSASPLRDKGGRLVGIAAIARDISARKAQEAEAEKTLADLSWVGRIRDALDEGHLFLDAQPIVDLATGEATQAELLIRMREPGGDVIPPGLFLPVAERYGLIQEIDRWVISQAARAAATGLKVEVNLSAVSIGQPALFHWVEDELAATGADPSNIVFEVTETALMQNVEAGTHFARRLTEMGCRFALDDFGTGYGSFTYLKQLPVHYLKIDIEFVRDLLDDEANQHVVRAVVNLAHGFGVKTVAEGVEDAETLDLLRNYGVDYAQGFYLGRPAELHLQGE